MRLSTSLPAIVAVVIASIQMSPSFAQSRFLVHLNQNQTNGDSTRTVTYYDADDFDSGPLFSVFIGFEEPGNNDEIDALTVDPTTGDVYVAAFDSGSTPGQNPGFAGTPYSDTDGDWDIYKIPFATTFSNWQSTYQGQDVRTAGLVNAGSPAPTANDSLVFSSDCLCNGSGATYANGTNLDYVIFGRDIDPNNSSFLSDFKISHANSVTLDGSIIKIGEVKRNNTSPSNFYDRSLVFVDPNTLIMVDDSTTATSVDTPGTDHLFRILERVSTSPNLADDAANNNLDGGFNRGTSESWNSTRLGLVNLDFDPNTGIPNGHSEPENTAFYNNGSGVRGVWVSENDGGGDDIAFLDLNASTKSNGTAGDQGTAVYRPIVTSSGFISTSPGVFNDPADFADPNAGAPNGRIENIFVDNNGDLIVVESGFLDSDPNAGIGLAQDHEPAVYRLPVTTYNDPNNRIVFGTPGTKFFLDSDPADPNNFKESPGEDPNDAFLKRGQYSAFDPISNTVIIVNPGSAAPDPNTPFTPGEAPFFGLDIHTINVDTGAVTSHLDLDDSVSLFLEDTFGDQVEFFSIGNPGDFDGNGTVDGLDFLAFQRGEYPNATLADWEANYNGGSLSTPAVSAVPEPSSAVLLTMAVTAFGVRRRKG